MRGVDTHGAVAGYLRDELRDVVAKGAPSPGRGRTEERFDLLIELGRRDLELARLAEAHLDAAAIADELGYPLRPAESYGVWAASSGNPLRARYERGRFSLSGDVPWCTGIAIIDRALVVADCDDGPILVDLGIADGIPSDAGSTWASPAFAATDTRTMTFQLDVAEDRVLGRPGAYLKRPGFWHGAIGVSACWAGGLRGLLDLHVERWRRRDPHALAHLGSAVAWSTATVDLLRLAARDIDDQPDDAAAAQERSRRVRHVIERSCTMAMDDLAVGAGPEPLAFDDLILTRTQQLQLYIRQCHGERDVEPVGSSRLQMRDSAGSTPLA